MQGRTKAGAGPEHSHFLANISPHVKFHGQELEQSRSRAGAEQEQELGRSTSRAGARAGQEQGQEQEQGRSRAGTGAQY